MKNALLQVLLILISSFCLSQTNDQKIEYILKTNGTIEGYKTMWIEMRLSPLKYTEDGKDSLKIIEIEKKLTDQEITKRLVKGFSEVFNGSEVDDIYKFYKTSAGQKFITSYPLLDQKFKNSFQDIIDELIPITEKIIKKNNKESENFKQIPVPTNKEDGFYSVLNEYPSFLKLDELVLSPKPEVTKSQILKIKKIFDNLGRFTIDITLNKEGAIKFKKLTENNIGKPIAIVLNKKIVSAPNVVNEIPNGRIQISGNFTEKEVDELMEGFKE